MKNDTFESLFDLVKLMYPGHPIDVLATVRPADRGNSEFTLQVDGAPTIAASGVSPEIAFQYLVEKVLEQEAINEAARAAMRTRAHQALSRQVANGAGEPASASGLLGRSAEDVARPPVIK